MILFCEYVVMHEHREAYLEWMRSRLGAGEAMQALENTGQPGVFVEIWQAGDAARAAAIEKERREGRSWQEMNGWIKGGEAGLRIWTFRSIGAD
ncbi:hypothetical protein [Cohnella sp. GCM10027633]|uniref:hypothetical protein n=1 Tax=unclassified Cohnella TaxID=2636738 RepID=UPI003633C479